MLITPGAYFLLCADRWTHTHCASNYIHYTAALLCFSVRPVAVCAGAPLPVRTVHVWLQDTVTGP